MEKNFDLTAPLNFAECKGDTITGFLLGMTDEQFEQVNALEAKQAKKPSRHCLPTPRMRKISRRRD